MQLKNPALAPNAWLRSALLVQLSNSKDDPQASGSVSLLGAARIRKGTCLFRPSWVAGRVYTCHVTVTARPACRDGTPAQFRWRTFTSSPSNTNDNLVRDAMTLPYTPLICARSLQPHKSTPRGLRRLRRLRHRVRAITSLPSSMS